VSRKHAIQFFVPVYASRNAFLCSVLLALGKQSCAVVEEMAALSFIQVVLAIFVRGSDSNAAARQCLPKKYLDFGIDAP